MDRPANVEILSMQMRRHAVWIWSLLLAIAVFLFQSGQLTYRIQAGPLFSVPWASLLARRVALLVAVLYLLRFLRHHLLRAAPPEARVPENPSVSYTLTGEPVIEDPEEEPTPATAPVALGATDDGTSLLWRALTAIVVALAIEIAADVWTLLAHGLN